MKDIIPLIISTLFCSAIFGQKIHIISKCTKPDSSLYHIERINKNEFWAGGKFGILKKIDTLGNVSALKFPNDGLSILKIINKENYIYLITDNAVIYRYDKLNQKFIKKSFPNYKNKCFYDLIALQSGRLMVCGGTKEISNGVKKIPNGFIALLDSDLNEISTVWRDRWKFVWSLLELENGDVLASTFNGINTKIIKTENYLDWVKDSSIKGLVHEIALLDNNIWYSGSRNIRYKKNGIIKMNNQKQLLLNKTGCLWSMDIVNGKIISVTANGKLIILDNKTSEIKQIDNTPFVFYDMEKISKSKLLLVGNGMGICIIDFSE